MDIILILVLLIVFAVVFVFFKANSQRATSGATWPFYAKKPLSQPEQVLYFRLTEALPEHIVLAQVQLSRILGIKKGHNHQSWLNRINRMSADFVVCNKDSSIVAVIELDDPSHQKLDRKTADEKKDKALSAAEIKIIRWQAKAIPDVSAIKAQFSTSLVSAN